MRPAFTTHSFQQFTFWRIGNLAFEDAYQSVFCGQGGGSLADALATATRLLPQAHGYQKEQTRIFIQTISKVPTTEELEVQIKLIELLAAAEGPHFVLEQLFFRRQQCDVSRMIIDDTRNPENRIAATRAYAECAVRIIQQEEDWKTTVVQNLLPSEYWAAEAVLAMVLDELEPEQQLEVVAHLFRRVASHGLDIFATSLEAVTAWLEDATHRATLSELLERPTDDPWEYLVVGMLRAGLADGVAKQMLLKRFGLDNLNRGDVMKMLIDSLDDQPDLAELMIELIQRSELDATELAGLVDGKPFMRTARAKHLFRWLRKVPARHRPHFLRFLQGLADTGKDGEAQSARNVLEGWK
jgi:hypothetical protein